MKFKITTNGYSVIYSGVVMLYDYNSDVTISVDTESEDKFKFKVILKFTEDGNKDYTLSKEVNDDSIVFTCTNFKSSLGIGTKKPLPLATVDDKEVSFHFCVYQIGEDVRRVEYTFLQDD